MGKGGKNSKNSSETPKRKQSDDEISPSLVRDQKRIKMPVNEEEFRKQTDMIAALSKKLDKLDMLDSMKLEIGEIKASQDELCNSFKGMEKRVENLERDVGELRESKVIEELQGEIKQLSMKNNALETKVKEMSSQSESYNNDTMIIRNLPLDVCDNDGRLLEVIDKVFAALNMPLNFTHYTATTKSVQGKNSARATIKFSSAMLKAKVIRQFRAIRNAENYDGELLVERVLQLPVGSPLNGVHLAMSSVLTKHNVELIKHARTFVKSHFISNSHTKHPKATSKSIWGIDA